MNKDQNFSCLLLFRIRKLKLNSKKKIPKKTYILNKIIQIFFILTPMSKDTGIKSYYVNKIEALEQLINDKTQNLKRLEAQRNDLNNQGKLIF